VEKRTAEMVMSGFLLFPPAFRVAFSGLATREEGAMAPEGCPTGRVAGFAQVAGTYGKLHPRSVVALVPSLDSPVEAVRFFYVSLIFAPAGMCVIRMGLHGGAVQLQ
jgi:hypothetical protein